MILLALAVLFALPHAYGEYRRTVLGLFDGVYWALAAGLLVSLFCLYLVMYPAIKASSEKKNKSATDTVTNTLSLCCLIIAIYAFAVSGVIALFF